MNSHAIIGLDNQKIFHSVDLGKWEENLQDDVNVKALVDELKNNRG